MKKLIQGCFILCAALLLNGCVLFHGYAPPLQQGNYLSVKQINKLRIGMSKTQVEAIMGTPILQNTFNDNQWDYVYTYAVQGHHGIIKKVVINFP